MAVNKVDVNGVTVLDLTQDSVTPETLKKGETAHDKSGAPIVGEMESAAPKLQSKAVSYTENGTATVTPDAGYDGLSSVDVTVDVSGGGGEKTTISDFKVDNCEESSISLSDVICDYWVINNVGSFSFSNCSNLTFTYCKFANAAITCSNDVYSAIVNGVGNDYSSAYFNII